MSKKLTKPAATIRAALREMEEAIRAERLRADNFEKALNAMADIERQVDHSLYHELFMIQADIKSKVEYSEGADQVFQIIKEKLKVIADRCSSYPEYTLPDPR